MLDKRKSVITNVESKWRGGGAGSRVMRSLWMIDYSISEDKGDTNRCGSRAPRHLEGETMPLRHDL